MEVEIAKEATKGQVLVLGQVLVAEEDHRVFGERAVDFVERAVAERLRQVYTTDLAADDRCQLVDGYCVVRPGIFADILDARTVASAQQAHLVPPILGLLAEHAAKDRIDMLQMIGRIEQRVDSSRFKK
jgi:hypothetical protein